MHYYSLVPRPVLTSDIQEGLGTKLYSIKVLAQQEAMLSTTVELEETCYISNNDAAIHSDTIVYVTDLI